MTSAAVSFNQNNYRAVACQGVTHKPLSNFAESLHRFQPSGSTFLAKKHSERDMKPHEPTQARTFADNSAAVQENEVAKQVADALVIDFAHYKSTPKVIARLAGASPQAAKNWLAGQHPPSLVSFLRLLPHSPSLRKLIAMEQDCDPGFQRGLIELMQRYIR
jgi:hypothetical protein